MGGPQKSMTDVNAKPSAGLLRRLGAMVYDTLLVIALLAAITFLFVPFLGGRVFVPEEVGSVAYLYRTLQLAALIVFFGFFWTHRGQTVGMIAWRLRIEALDGSGVKWSAALKRLTLLFALLLPFILGYWFVWRDWPRGLHRSAATVSSLLPAFLSYLWIWIDRDHLAWHDRWSGTRIVVLPKSAT
jgi:uncharacterized RDD family membrane protein YckC